MKNIRWYYRAGFAAALAIAVWPLFAPAPQTDMPISAWAQLPLLEGGRVKPIDSFARNSLLVIHGTQSLRIAGRTISAAEWLFDTLFKPETADTRKVFVIDDPDVLGVLGLQADHERRFPYWQIEAKRNEIMTQAEKASAVDSKKRSRFQSAVVNLAHRLELYEQIKNTLMISGSKEPDAELATFATVIPIAQKAQASKAKPGQKEVDAMKAMAELLERYQFLARASAFRAVPPPESEKADAWLSYGDAVLKNAGNASPHPVLTAIAVMGRAGHNGEAALFRSALLDYTAWLSLVRPDEARQARWEVVFNTAQPFIAGMTLYVLTLLAVFAWWATRRADVQAVATGLFTGTVLVHTVGLVSRIILQGRPPVTNLYSSAVFVGWAAALLSLVAERVHKKGFAIAGGSLLGFCTLLIAQHLSASGDTMEMMRAVLDSNFWLGTHVVTVTIGYAGTFLAGALGITWILRRHLVADPDPETTRALVSLAYGVIAFSLLFSFVGTVLGGIWADQSWGRFWGWDPKENGALLIVLWNALILHARFAGYARERGVMVMTVFGNIVTSLSWFGVNMLGIGLHSYGFMDKAFYWLLAFAISQAALMWLGMMPARFWKQEAA
jgi:ABC-type transport system involved in cytochrome c biogenesis permease subunit